MVGVWVVGENVGRSDASVGLNVSDGPWEGTPVGDGVNGHSQITCGKLRSHFASFHRPNPSHLGCRSHNMAQCSGASGPLLGLSGKLSLGGKPGVHQSS